MLPLSSVGQAALGISKTVAAGGLRRSSTVIIVLTLMEKTFAVLVVIRVMGITVGVGLTLAVFCIR